MQKNLQLSLISLDLARLSTPPPQRATWQWANEHRILPLGSSEAGPWNSDRVPWTKAITEAAENPKIKKIVCVMGSQLSKTDGVLINMIGKVLMDDPAPIIYFGPTRKNVESISTGRVAKMIYSVPQLHQRLERGKKEKITEKYFNGIRLGFGWAGSATELASHPARLVLIDERDRMKDIKGEGDPVELGEVRTSTYPNGLVIVVSSPTEGQVDEEHDEQTGLTYWALSKDDSVSSPIWKEFETGTRQEWAWACPDCHQYFIPRKSLLYIPENVSPTRARKETRLICPHCGVLIEDKYKPQMNASGVFISRGQQVIDGQVTGELPESTTASFWVSGLCSPWVTWGERAEKLIKAQRKGDTRAVINTGFGELYAPQGGTKLDWTLLKKLRQDYQLGTVPKFPPYGAQVLTCGVDIQKNGLYYSVRGWGANETSWLVDYGFLTGNTLESAVWQSLEELIDAEYDGETITYVAIDSGYRATEVYEFCRKHKHKVLPTKGHDTQLKPYHATKIDVTFKGSISKSSLLLWHINTDEMKQWLCGRYEWKETEGGWFIPINASDEYCQQVTAEYRVMVGNKPKWKKTGENHYFDCEVLNVFLSKWLKVKKQLKPLTQLIAPNTPQNTLSATHSRRKQRRVISQGI